MSPLDTLPPELWLMLMTSFDDPDDLFSLIQACPNAFQNFVYNKGQITRGYMRDLETLLEGPIPASALLAAQLYHDKLSWTAGMTKHEAEGRLLRLISPYRDGTFTATHLPLPTQLLGLSILWATILDAVDTLSSYSTDAWKEITKIMAYFDKVPEGMESNLELTATERRRFQHALFHYDGYCQAFFHDQELLFWNNRDLRRYFLSPMLRGPEQATAVEQFYSITYYVYNQHWLLMKSVASHIRTTPGSPYQHFPMGNPNKFRDIEVEIPYISLLVTDGHFKHGDVKLHEYLSYLTSQGLDLLSELWRMDIEELTEFTLGTYERIHFSTQPAFLLTEVRGYRLGVIEGEPWLPWIHCVEVSFWRHLDWRKAHFLWDKPRRDSIAENIARVSPAHLAFLATYKP